jgi:hypothetical protein
MQKEKRFPFWGKHLLIHPLSWQAFSPTEPLEEVGLPARPEVHPKSILFPELVYAILPDTSDPATQTAFRWNSRAVLRRWSPHRASGSLRDVLLPDPRARTRQEQRGFLVGSKPFGSLPGWFADRARGWRRDLLHSNPVFGRRFDS